MSVKFKEGDSVNVAGPEERFRLGPYTIEMVGEEIIYLKNQKGELAEAYENELRHVTKLFAVYYHHGYGSTQWIIRSSIDPTEEQVVECLGINFEPEKEEFIAIEEIETINVLELS